jgi:hypothetical protein
MVSELVHPPVQHQGKCQIIQRDVFGFLVHDDFEKVKQRIFLVVTLPPVEHLAKVGDDLPDLLTLDFREWDMECGHESKGGLPVVF